MKFHVQLMAAIMGAHLAGAAGAASDPTEMVATVQDFNEPLTGSCVPSSAGHHPWDLQIGSEFDFQELGSKRYGVRPVSSGLEEEIKEPVYLRVNAGKSWLDDAPCKKTLKNREFLLALHELAEPGHGTAPSWHALIYIPVNISGNDQFYLVLLSIVNDATKCKSLNGKPKARCEALRELAVMKMDSKPLKEIHDRAIDLIDAILPEGGFSSSPPAVKAVLYHNGVVHGSLF
jgi:hypothetical protein